MKKDKKYKLRKKVYDKQYKYEKLRKEAYKELESLEEFFGKRKSNRKDILWELILHLEASQKEITYSGHRGVVLGIVTSILLYVFNTGVLSEMINYNVSGNWLVKILVTVSVSLIVGFFFMFLYYVAAGHFFKDDKKLRNQIYINEFMLNVAKNEYKNLD